MASGRYRTFWPRFWAGWIDALVFFPLTELDYLAWDPGVSPDLRAVWVVATGFAFVVYSIFCHACWGQTIGKRLMRVRVLDVSETPIRLKQAVIRDAISVLFAVADTLSATDYAWRGVERVYDLDALSMVEQAVSYGATVWCAVELFTMLYSRKRRAIHDLMAGTVVVRTGVVDV